mgnify:FL=1
MNQLIIILYTIIYTFIFTLLIYKIKSYRVIFTLALFISSTLYLYILYKLNNGKFYPLLQITSILTILLGIKSVKKLKK